MAWRSRQRERVARAGVTTYPDQVPDMSDWPPQVAVQPPGSPPPARVCPECGKWHSSDRAQCAACRLRELEAKDPKAHPSKLPCCVCGQTHSNGWWELARTTGKNRAQRLPLCSECDVIVYRHSTMNRMHGTELGAFHAEFSDNGAPVFRELRDFPAETGHDDEEIWLDVRVGRLMGIAAPWRDRRPETVPHGLVRHLMRLDDPGPKRPKIASELPKYGPTEEPSDPLRWIPLSAARASRFRINNGGRLVSGPPGHIGSGRRLPVDAFTINLAHDILHLARQGGISAEEAAATIQREEIGLIIDIDERTRAAALELARKGPLPPRVLRTR